MAENSNANGLDNDPDRNDKSSSSLKISPNQIIFFVVFCVVIAVLPYIFTHLFGFSFNETAQVGDTIGGITAPFIGLLGSVLVFFTLRAQINANERVQRQLKEQESSADHERNFSNLLKVFDHVKNDLDQTEFIDEMGDHTSQFTENVLRGRYALSSLWWDIQKYHCRDLNNESTFRPYGYPVLVGALRLLSKISADLSTNRLSDIDRQILISLISYLYESRIAIYYQKGDTCKENCELEHHPLYPKELIDLVSEINTSIVEGTVSSFVDDVNKDAESIKKI